MVLQDLRSEHRPGNWGQTYPEVLPYVRHAYSRTLERIKADLPERIRDALLTAIAQLCDPDPEQRGHPLERTQNGQRYSLQRYVSLFDLLARRSEYTLRTAIK